MTPIAQLNDNSVTASMERIRALFDKYLPNGRLVGAVANTKRNKPKADTIRLGAEVVGAIKTELGLGSTVREICKRFGVKPMTVYRIKNKQGRFK